jgi:hypothetical protein
MCMCAFILCIGSGLAKGWSPDDYETVKKKAARAQRRAVEPLMNGTSNY